MTCVCNVTGDDAKNPVKKCGKPAAYGHQKPGGPVTAGPYCADHICDACIALASVEPYCGEGA